MFYSAFLFGCLEHTKQLPTENGDKSDHVTITELEISQFAKNITATELPNKFVIVI